MRFLALGLSSVRLNKNRKKFLIYNINIEFEIFGVTKRRIGVIRAEMAFIIVGGAEGAPMRSGGGVGARGRRRRPPWRPHYGPERVKISKMKLVGEYGCECGFGGNRGWGVRIQCRNGKITIVKISKF